MELKEKVSLGFFGLFALIGTIFAIVAYVSWQKTYRIVQNGVQTQGIVIENRHDTSKIGPPGTSLAPVVRFMTEQRTPVTYYSQTYTTPASFEVGQAVTLWYLPANPQDATLEGADSWIFPLVFGLFGVVLSLIGYPLLVSALLKSLKE